MGVNESRTEVKQRILNRSIMNMSSSNETNCENTQTVNAVQHIKNIEADGCGLIIDGIEQDTRATQMSVCVQEITNKDKFLQDLKVEVKKQVEREMESGAWGVNLSSTEIDEEITNEFETNINLENLMNCVSEQTTDPQQVIENIKGKDCYKVAEFDPTLAAIRISNIKQHSYANAAMNCSNKHFTATDTIHNANVKSKFEQRETMTGYDPLGFIGDMFSGLGALGAAPWIASIICCCICLSISIASMIMPAGGSGGAGGPMVIGGGSSGPSMAESMMPMMMAMAMRD